MSGAGDACVVPELPSPPPAGYPPDPGVSSLPGTPRHALSPAPDKKVMQKQGGWKVLLNLSPSGDKSARNVPRKRVTIMANGLYLIELM
jgi:hypothetical protein